MNYHIFFIKMFSGLFNFHTSTAKKKCVSHFIKEGTKAQRRLGKQQPNKIVKAIVWRLSSAGCASIDGPSPKAMKLPSQYASSTVVGSLRMITGSAILMCVPGALTSLCASVSSFEIVKNVSTQFRT